MSKDRILKSETLAELLDAIDKFCIEMTTDFDEKECMELKSKLETADNNDYFVILSSYLIATEDGDEVVEALYEFVANCKAFVESDEETAEQITKDEFEAVLDECEDKCSAVSCLEAEHTINIAEVSMTSQCIEFCIREKNDSINIFLPKYNIQQFVDKEKYVANIIGTVLFSVISKKLEPEYILCEINRFIPKSRIQDKCVKELFVEYFYDVVKYKEQKPKVYAHFDKHLERVMSLEFYKRIIREYLKLLE